MRVHHAQAHDETLPNRRCDECGTEFYSKEERRYCSADCLDNAGTYAGAANPNYIGGMETTICEECGAEFEYYPSEKDGLFCPRCVETTSWRHRPDVTGAANPRWKGGTQTVECVVCDEAVERYPSEVKSDVVLCSRECLGTWLSDAFAGDGHPNWMGGENIAYGPGWNEVRQRALERDDHECDRCGIDRDELERNPDVHHIIPVWKFLEAADQSVADAHYLENVVSLCPSCHRRVEFGTVSSEVLRRVAAGEYPRRP